MDFKGGRQRMGDSSTKKTDEREQLLKEAMDLFEKAFSEKDREKSKEYLNQSMKLFDQHIESLHQELNEAEKLLKND